jgi:hypothetical protein
MDTSRMFLLVCPWSVQFFQKKIWMLAGYGPKKRPENFANFYFLLFSMLNTYLLFTLLDLGLYSKDHLMTMEVLYYP